MTQKLDITDEKADEKITDETGTRTNPLETPATTLTNPVIAQIDAGTLRYAKAGPAMLTRPAHRIRRLDWYEIGVITLLLSSAATCIFRLLWAVQP